MSELKEYKEFKKLLRDGIGTRSQKEFAAAAGISAPWLNKMLNSEKIAQPSKETITKIVENIKGASMNEFLAACGYEPVLAEDIALKLEEDLEGGVGAYGNMLHPSMDAFFDTLESLYLTVPVQDIRADGDEEDSDRFPDAERSVPVCVRWSHEDICIETRFTLYFNRTTGGKVMPVHTSITDKENEKETEWEEKRSSGGFVSYMEKIFHCSTFRKEIHKGDMKKNKEVEERLLEALLGKRGSGCSETVTAGYGFYYNETPSGFKNFLMAHASAFCTTTDNAGLFEEMLKPDADPDVIFEAYCPQDGSACGSALGITIGSTGTAVAEILREETGLDFRYYVEEAGKGDACIMFSEPSCEDGEGIDTYLPMLYGYAKELSVPTFGMCYHIGYIKRMTFLEFETDKFYLKFKK